MISDIFDFSYAWEIYKVPEKRQFGYYTMPILYSTRFVGRIDLKWDRKNKTMIINSMVLEKNRFQEDLVVELAGTLKSFLRFHDASQVKIVKTKPKRLKNELLAELHQSG